MAKPLEKKVSLAGILFGWLAKPGNSRATMAIIAIAGLIGATTQFVIGRITSPPSSYGEGVEAGQTITNLKQQITVLQRELEAAEIDRQVASMSEKELNDELQK